MKSIVLLLPIVIGVVAGSMWTCSKTGDNACDGQSEVEELKAKRTLLGNRVDALEFQLLCVEANPCQNGGTCFVEAGEAQCLCPETHQGDHCEVGVLCVKANPCQNGGTCFVEAGGAQCLCPETHQGDHCEAIKAPECPEKVDDQFMFLDGQMCLVFKEGWDNWDAAKSYCEALIPGRTFLVEWHSEAEFNSTGAAWQAARDAGKTASFGFWTGGKDPYNDPDRFVWERSNVTFAFNNHSEDDPVGTDEECVRFNVEEGFMTDSTWFTTDRNCDNTLSTICRYQ